MNPYSGLCNWKERSSYKAVIVSGLLHALNNHTPRPCIGINFKSTHHETANCLRPWTQLRMVLHLHWYNQFGCYPPWDRVYFPPSHNHLTIVPFGHNLQGSLFIGIVQLGIGTYVQVNTPRSEVLVITDSKSIKQQLQFFTFDRSHSTVQARTRQLASCSTRNQSQTCAPFK